jgi:hypothetical protein
MVHAKTFVPVTKLVTAELLSVGVVIDEVPINTDHVPVPTRGMLPARIVVSVHKF